MISQCTVSQLVSRRLRWLANCPRQVPDLEQSVEEGYVVGPFLQGRLEQQQRLVDSGSVSAVGLVLDGGILYATGSVTRPREAVHEASYPPPPRWFLHCRGMGESRPELSGDPDRTPGPSSSAIMTGWSVHGRDQ